MDTEIRKNTKAYHTCDICKRMFINIKSHLREKHRHVGEPMPRPKPSDPIEYWKAYYNYLLKG